MLTRESRKRWHVQQYGCDGRERAILDQMTANRDARIRAVGKQTDSPDSNIPLPSTKNEGSALTTPMQTRQAGIP